MGKIPIASREDDWPRQALTFMSDPDFIHGAMALLVCVFFLAAPAVT
jgi:hypothetical protein